MTVPSDHTADAARAAPGPVARLKAVVSLLRLPQWIKNAFVLAPLFFTPQAMSGQTATRALLGVLCFCLISSCVYIINDLSDREADRSHPTKCRRPLAAGTVSTAEALVLMVVLCGIGFAGAASLSGAFALVLALYFSINLAYSFGLKHWPILDLLAIAAGFVLRVDARLLSGRGLAGGRGAIAVTAFIAGYGIAWTVYGALAFMLDAAIREGAGGLIPRLGLGPILAGAVLVLAGLYQVSPLKQACLTHCRTPLGYLARQWRPGGGGALCGWDSGTGWSASAVAGR